MYLLWCVKLKVLSFIRKDCVSVATIIKYCDYDVANFHYYLHCINGLSLQYLVSNMEEEKNTLKHNGNEVSGH